LYYTCDNYSIEEAISGKEKLLAIGDLSKRDFTVLAAVNCMVDVIIMADYLPGCELKNGK
jgi:hypothetical protein